MDVSRLIALFLEVVMGDIIADFFHSFCHQDVTALTQPVTAVHRRT